VYPLFISRANILFPRHSTKTYQISKPLFTADLSQGVKQAGMLILAHTSI